MPLWLREKLHLPREMSRGPEQGLQASATSSPSTTSRTRPAPSSRRRSSEAAILTLDGVGEWATASFGIGRGQPDRSCTHELRFPHSLGLLYSAFTYFCGFRVNSGEYKLMGLAPYGEPRYADLILEQADRPERRRLVPPGHVVLQLLPGPDDDLAASSHELFGGPPRKPEVAARPSARWTWPRRSRR